MGDHFSLGWFLFTSRLNPAKVQEDQSKSHKRIGAAATDILSARHSPLWRSLKPLSGREDRIPDPHTSVCRARFPDILYSRKLSWFRKYLRCIRTPEVPELAWISAKRAYYVLTFGAVSTVTQQARISRKTVDAAVAAERDFILWDRDLKGFGLRVTPNGNKSYVVQYRMGGRGFNSKRRTIGRDGSPWNPTTARAEAERLLHLVGLGHDPALQDQERQRAQLHARFDQFVEHFLELHGKRNWAPRTYSTHKSNVDRWLLPVLGKKEVTAITRRDITDVLDRIPSGRPALPRNVFVLMRTIFNWAIDRGELEKSPMLGMKVPRSAPERHHILSDEELVVVAATAPQLGPVWGNLLHLLIFTGQRLREVAHADWSELDREGRQWLIPRDRTKNGRDHIVPLNKAALATLDACARIQADDKAPRWPRSGLVLSHVAGKPISGFSKAKARLDSLLATKEPQVRAWRLHDLRRTVATNMQRLGVRFEVTEAILNHVSVAQAGIVSVYQRHDWQEEKRAALDAWADKLLAMVAGYEAARLRDAEVAKTRANAGEKRGMRV